MLAATSGHSGVDRILGNLARQFDTWGLGVDVLHVQGHGPHIDMHGLTSVRVVNLGVAHVATALPALVRYLRRTPPAALLCDKDKVNRMAILAGRLSGARTRLCVRLGTAVSVNLAERAWWERRLQRTSMRYLYPLADRVIVPAEGVRADLCHFAGLDPRRITVIRSPILTPELDVQAAASNPHPWLAPGEPPVILAVGELSYRKDFATLVRAFAGVRRARPCRLIILGRGRRGGALQALAAELGVGADLALPGFQTNPYAWLSRARLFVLSSLWEGLPVALVEALALGLPAVATDCPGGPAEVLTRADCGTLVPVGDDQAMARAIHYWLENRPAPEQLAELVAPYRITRSARAYLDALGIQTDV
jgi:glycosyltransferase involved in cell wall biosynthesis